MKRKIKIGGILTLVLLITYVNLLLFPSILFTHHHQFKNFNIYSDREIPQEIDSVLKDVLARISHSELYEESDQFSIFFCNSKWRLVLLTRNPNVGGLVNQGLSEHIFIRESEIEKNKIVSPSENEEIALSDERPLSYFMAHEITHSLQTKIDRFMHLTTPTYIVEGYADYIGKSLHFQYDAYLSNYLKGDMTMNPENGLYNKYHLLIAYLIDKKGMSFREIAKHKPKMEVVEHEIKTSNTPAPLH